jgi:exo-1,4-beta-D-glucosaminidase
MKPFRLLKLFTVSLLCVAPTLLSQIAKQPAIAVSDLMPLHAGWALASGCKVTDTGDKISTAAYKPQGWIATTVPSTVLAAQVAAKLFPDPDYGYNLRNVPGTTYAIGSNFSTQKTPQDSPYRCAWWYRKTFTLPAADEGKQLWLRIDGINYRANVWLNGQRIADSKQVQGAFQTFDLNMTAAAQPGKENAIAFEVFGPTEEDLTISWADWSPDPPDKEMGLWKDVSIATTGDVALTNPLVTTHFTDASLKQADLNVYGQVRNGADKPVHGVVSVTLAGIHLQQPVDLAANEEREVTFAPAGYPQLHVQNPSIWWPWQMGKANLETITMRFTEGAKTSDEVSARFGIREITDSLDDPKGCAVPPPNKPDYIPTAAETAPPPRNPTAQANNSTAATSHRNRDNPNICADHAHRLYKVNGQPIFIRGGGWAPDMMLRNQPEKVRQEFRMVRDLGLNTIRLEGKMETEDFFHLADEQGMLVMIGWTCCDRYEKWRNWTPENQTVAVASLHSQILRLRNHPSMLVWLNGSDNPPPANIEPLYLNEEKTLHFPDPTLSSATAKPTSVTGESGVKMNGPYDYVTPSYWTATDLQHKYGGAWGFATEIGPGAAIPTLVSMRKFLPEQSIWPHDDVWRFHAGGEGFKDVTRYDAAMKNIYGPATSAEDYDRVSQTIAYDGERAMFEAYSRNKYASTGVIQWMLNNSWPSMIWNLYDYYLGTGGGYYGTKKSNEPLHIQYSYDDHSIWVVNSTYTASQPLVAEATVYDNNMKQVFDQRAPVTLPADGTVKAMPIDDAVFASGSPMFFVDLQLRNRASETLSHNFYWLSSKPTTYDWAKTSYIGTPISSYEDMTALRQLPQATIEATAKVVNGHAEVQLHNPSKALAFQVAVSTDPTSKDIEPFPVLWSDNYVELLPGASMTLSAPLASSQNNPAIHISGWNVASQTIHPEGSASAVKSAR